MDLRRHIQLLLAAALLLALPSCRMVSSIIHDGEVVAKVGKHRLSRAEVESVIPVGTPSEDSLKIAQQYINTWASDLIFEDAATKGLTKKDQDVTAQLEQYRRALIKYRYEELFVNERLDTTVSEIDVRTYYDEHQDLFELSFPIVKARFIRLSPQSPSLSSVKKLIASEDDSDIAELEDLAATAADKYTDFGGRWLDITALADEFGCDYGTLLALMTKSTISYIDGNGELNYAYITDYIRAGAVPPVEYCESMIKDVIINARKQELLTGLERDLLDDARAKGEFVIY